MSRSRAPSDRVRFLADAWADDAAMREEVEALLASHDDAGGVFKRASRPRIPRWRAPVSRRPQPISRRDSGSVPSKSWRLSARADAGGRVQARQGLIALVLSPSPHTEPCEDHAAYIANWLDVLTADNRAIFAAASHAQRAADFINGLQPASAG